LGLEDRHLPDEGWQDMATDGTSDGDEDIEEEDYMVIGCKSAYARISLILPIISAFNKILAL
jgi:hypothetical protein